MKKVTKFAMVAFGIALAALIIFVAGSAALYSPEYIYRVIVNGESGIEDYRFFPERAIPKSSQPYQYAYDIDESVGTMSVQYNAPDGSTRTAQLMDLLKANGTTSLIVVRDDTVIFETYLNEYFQTSVNTSFSSVKSLDSLMIGMAIEDGFILNVRQPISDFIPEFKDTAFADITIENLLTMRSPIRYEEGLIWFTDDAKTYYMPDLRDLALHKMRIDADYSGGFHYNNYHPLLLGIILERSTGRSVADYFGQKIWDQIGAEYDASWSLDSEENGFEKMESGLNFVSIDYAKIGSMLLHRGQWNGVQVIGEDWIDRSTVAHEVLSEADAGTDHFEKYAMGYRYMWYSMPNGQGGYDYFAAGKYGQYLYISPENNTVIVRIGNSEGDVACWPLLLGQVAAHGR